MPFNSFGQVIDCFEQGKTFLSVFRKVPAVATAAGIWFDLSMVSGIPAPNYYASAPAVAEYLIPNAPLSGTTGIQYGSFVSPATRHLIRAMITATIAPIIFYLCDYLLYYPFFDMGDLTEQATDNTKAITRYTDGVGVKIMAVEVAPQAGGASFYVTYTNQDGTAGRRTKTVITNTQTVNGTIINTTSTSSVSGYQTPFLPLQEGDTGVRSIQSLTMVTADTGLITLVLVKPLANLTTREISTPAEVDFLKDRPSLPKIYDQAFLGFVCMSQGSLSGVPIQGELQFIWN